MFFVNVTLSVIYSSFKLPPTKSKKRKRDRSKSKSKQSKGGKSTPSAFEEENSPVFPALKRRRMVDSSGGSGITKPADDHGVGVKECPISEGTVNDGSSSRRVSLDIPVIRSKDKVKEWLYSSSQVITN